MPGLSMSESGVLSGSSAGVKRLAGKQARHTKEAGAQLLLRRGGQPGRRRSPFEPLRADFAPGAAASAFVRGKVVRCRGWAESQRGARVAGTAAEEEQQQRQELLQCPRNQPPPQRRLQQQQQQQQQERLVLNARSVLLGWVFRS